MPLYSNLEETIKFTGTFGTNVVQGYSFVGDNTPETLIAYCKLIYEYNNILIAKLWGLGTSIMFHIIEVPKPHSFAMESVKICHFKTFRAGNFALRTFCCFFLIQT